MEAARGARRDELPQVLSEAHDRRVAARRSFNRAERSEEGADKGAEGAFGERADEGVLGRGARERRAEEEGEVRRLALDIAGKEHGGRREEGDLGAQRAGGSLMEEARAEEAQAARD
jgi:hypothetical protein